MAVEREIVGQPFVTIGSCFIALQINIFVLHTSPKPLNEDVVNGAAATIHADVDVIGLQPFNEESTGELSSLIGIEDLRPAMVKCFVESSRQNSTSMLLDNRQLITCRLYQSITATR